MQTEIDESISIKIVGISGKKFNGKDTLGVYFITKYGFKRIAFADALKDACKAIFNFSNEQLYGNEKEIIDPYWNVTPRKVLEYLGTDLCRNQLGNILPDVGSDLWVKVAKKKIEDTLKQNPNAKFVFTVNNCNESNRHVSEDGIPAHYIDCVIKNNGTVEDLHEAVRKIVEVLSV